MRSQLDTRRTPGSNLETNIPNLTSIFSTLIPNSDRNSSKTNNETTESIFHSNQTTESSSALSDSLINLTNEVTAIDDVPSELHHTLNNGVTIPPTSVSPVSPVSQLASNQDHADEQNLISQPNTYDESNDTTKSTTNSTTSAIRFTTPETSLGFSPSAQIGLSLDEFQPRSGLVEDIYDYANDFGLRLSSANPNLPASRENDRLSPPTLPTLYPRDQPQDLIPVDNVRQAGSPLVRPPGLPPVEWQPNWPSDLVPTPVSINMNYPSDSSSYYVRSFHLPNPTTVQFPVRKEPITQYYFDLADASVSSSNVERPQFERNSATVIMPQPSIVSSLTPDIVPENRVSSTILQPSISSVDESSISPVTPMASLEMSLNTGIDINQIYSSAFFPSALPSAIHISHTDSPTIETVHNDIRENPPLPHGDLDGHIPSRPINDTTSTHILYNNTIVNQSQAEYILGSDTDYYFPTNSDGVQQDLGVSDTAERHVNNEDELSFGTGNFPAMSFALPTAIPSSASPTQTASVDTLVQNSTHRKRFASKSRAALAESRKPLWMLLSDKSDLANTDMVSPTPAISDIIFETDFPVGILSNRVPIQQTMTTTVPQVSASIISSFESAKTSFDIKPTSVLASSTQHTKSTSTVDETTIRSSLLDSTSSETPLSHSPAPNSNIDFTPPITHLNIVSVSMTDSTFLTTVNTSRLENSWKPLTNHNTKMTESIERNRTSLSSSENISPTPASTIVQLQTGGFTPIAGQSSHGINSLDTMESNLDSMNDHSLITSTTPIVDLNIAPIDNVDDLALIAPTSNLTALNHTYSNVVDSNRSLLESALLHNVPETIVASVTPRRPAAPTPSFGAGFRFRPATPNPKTVVENFSSTSNGLVTAVLGVNPKSSGTSGFDDGFQRTTPHPTWFNRPYDYSSFDVSWNNTNNGTESIDFETEENTTYQRKPSTYVYPQELLPVTDSPVMDNGNFETEPKEEIFVTSGSYKYIF